MFNNESTATLRKSAQDRAFGFAVELDDSPAHVNVPRDVFIDSVVAGGIAQGAGLKKGMQIISINNVDVRNSTEAQNIIETAMACSQVELILLEKDPDGLSTEKREKMNLLRKHILQELLENETNYVRAMEFIVETFIKKLEKIDPDKIPNYFSNLTEISKVNKKLLESMAPEIEQNDGAALSKVFMKNINSLHVYTKYVGEIQFILKEIEALTSPKSKHSSSSLKHALKEIFEEGEEIRKRTEFKKFDLNNLLKRPFQMITRYPMLIDRILEKGMAPSHPDFEPLTECLQRLKKLADEVNTHKKRYDELFEISLKLKDYNGSALHLLGELVHKGNVQARDVISGMASRKGPASLQKTARIGFLFSDSKNQLMRVILTQPGALRSDPGSTYYYVKDTKLLTKDTHLRSGDMTFTVDAENNFPNAWTVECRHAFFTLSVKVPVERQQWLDIMQRQLDIFNDVKVVRQSSTVHNTTKVTRDWELNRYDVSYSSQDAIGRGNFGDVMKGTYTIYGEQEQTQVIDVAIKQLQVGLKSTDFVKEFAVMKAVQHDNVLFLHGVCSLEEPFLIVTELMNRKDLRHFLTTAPEADKMVLNDLIHLSTHIVNGMTYLSELQIVHRDLRAENILLKEEEDSLVAKVGDFGLARMSDGKYYGDTVKEFPVKWTAPEAIARGKYTTHSDVWSFGVCLYEIITQGMVPYMAMKNETVIEKVLNEGYRIACPVGLRFPEMKVREVHDISMKCWAADPLQRPSFPDILVELTKVTATAGVIGSVAWPSLHILKQLSAGCQMFDGVVMSRGTLHVNASDPRSITITTVNDMRSIHNLDFALAEEETLKQLDHKNVVSFLGLSSGTHPLYTIELFSHHVGTLSSFLLSFKEEGPDAILPVASLVDVSWQIANGMEYLHAKKIYHGALCSKNIAYGRGGSCRVGGLAYARIRNHAVTQTMNRYSSPEVLVAKQSTMVGDVWSFGMVLHELFTMGDLPFASTPDEHMAEALARGEQPGPRPTRATIAVYTIMQKCYSVTPSLRPSFTNLKVSLSASEVFNAEAYVVCIQTAWREYRSRKTFIHLVRQVRIWCDVLQLDPTDLTATQLSKVLAKAERDIAQIQAGAKEGGATAYLSDVERVFKATGGDIATSIQLLSQHTVTANGANHHHQHTHHVGSISPSHLHATSPPPDQDPPPVPHTHGGGDDGDRPPLCAIRLVRDNYPINVFNEDTRPVIEKLRSFLRDAIDADEAQEAYVNYAELEHFVNGDEYHEAIGWDEDGSITHEMAADIVVQLEQLVVD